MATLLWILAVVLVVAGIFAIVRRQLVWGIVLIVVGLLVGPGGVSIFTLTAGGRSRPAGGRLAAHRAGRTAASMACQRRRFSRASASASCASDVGGGSGGRPASSQRCRSSRVNRGSARGSAGIAPHSWQSATWS